MPATRTGRAAFLIGSMTFWSIPVGTRGLASGLVSVVPGTATTIAPGQDAADEVAIDAPVGPTMNATRTVMITERTAAM